ncbi:tripartite tricarboxylate transporter permease [uncultured Ilyobacter sp.]|jgi:putative tricarboxylic transport membrane protein|uniref:tripartite tricarboxylate transporter permease n=1 Tax=uncultured Ilyobacter sp. TaxID=544433 RepID=UPI0029C0098F|nr:tripartite tricarboxylate transporter permease [uncultured Ilyobacter sp.]
MDTSLLIEALKTIFMPTNFLLVLAGMTLGVFFGALPGISSSMGIVLMIPFTYYMGIIPSIVLLVALYAGSAYGGSITAILFNTPGTAESVATTFDGYPMAQQGKAGKALGLAMSGSAIGGIFSVLVMLLLAPLLSKIALKIQSAEYFALTLLGIACISSVGSKNLSKALVTGLLGIIIAMVGMDPMTGVSRLTFGQINFLNGIEYIPIMIGSFAMAEVFKQVINRKSEEKTMDMGSSVSMESIKLKDLLKYKVTIIKSAIIGTAVGILPGTGGSIASIVSYGEAARSSKDKSRFGNGAEEGVLAPETANNAAGGGAMIPTLVLGIPGSPTTAIILAALVLQGLQPGPQLMTEQPLLLYCIFFSMLIASVVVFLSGRYAVKAFAAVLKLPYGIIAPMIVMFSIIGAYARSNDMFQIWVMLTFGVFGYFMKKYQFSAASLILGIVLGNMMEESFRRQLLISNGSYMSFLQRPIAVTIFIAVAFVLFFPIVAGMMEKKKATAAAQNL